MTQSGRLYDKVVIYMDMRGVLVFCDNEKDISGVVGDFADKLGGDDMAYFLTGFLSALLAHDYIYMEKVEKELGKIETKILSEHTPNCAEQINSYRRKVAVIKRYYEQLYEVTNALGEEDFLTAANDELTTINTKVERLREEALYLRDYMSQVREAYQQGVDLSLNSVMKFLSAATLLFAPLQFLVGWFGMNFIMPETESTAGYAIPIVMSVVIVLVVLYIFKRKKWF
jgi:magnesium transporter